MKKTLIVTLALGAAMVTGVAFAALTDPNDGLDSDTLNRDGNKGGAGIIGSSHDLGTGLGYDVTGMANADARDRICIFCHTPHHSMTPAQAGGYSPLWNRQVTDRSFAVYNNGMMMMTEVNGETAPTSANNSDARNWMNGTPLVAGVSLLCMSCHDGATAMNAYSGNRGTTGDPVDGVAQYAPTGGNVKIIGGADLAGGQQSEVDMSNHHPIGMVWADVVAQDGEIAPMSTEYGTKIGAAGVPNPNTNGVGIGVTIEGLLYKDKMECVTCHDVHNTQNEPGAERFLWVTNENSAFCLTCHLK